MANYHAVYIDSPYSWTYNTDSYDSKLGFYSNAWLTNETEETSETPVISCSYFYELGKQDEVGFTPRRISMNESSGILTVEGKQENVSSLVSKSFRLNSPSPRFLNLRESMRKRRPARFIVNNIITDDDAELNNIKDYLGLNEEEAEVISRAEEFGAEEFDEAGYPLNMTRFSYQREETTEAYPNGLEILSYSIYFGNDWMFNLNSALFGYDDERVQGIVDELNESIRSSMQQVFQRLNWKSQRHDSLDVMLRSEEFGAEDEEFMYHVYISDYSDSVGFMDDSNRDFENKSDAKRAAEKVAKNEGKGKWVLVVAEIAEDEYEEIIYEITPDGDVYDAEEFGAEDEDEKAERIMKLLRIVKRKATGSNARYAKTYAREAENAYYQYGMRGLTTQVAYVLSNLSGWRGEEAKSVKAELRKLIK